MLAEMMSPQLPTRLLLVAILATACVKSETKQCGQNTCSANAVCTANDRCVSPQQLDECIGKTEGMGCTLAGTDVAVCDADLVCVSAGCGNRIIEPLSGEICDDGNRNSGDLCSADCKSTETCGDGVTDFNIGEQCDCGTTPNAMPVACTAINSMSKDAECRPDCTLRGCGDMVVDTFEVCDDGNNVPGDGCRADCQGRWTRMQSNTLATLVSVWASSATDAWAVSPTGGVIHWDGTEWTSRNPPGVSGGFFKVWGISAQEVFVLRATNGANASQVWRYFNGTWADKTPDPGIAWRAMHANGTNLWVIGWLTFNGNAAAVHWNGSSFDAIESIFQLSDAPEDAFVSPDGKVYFAANSLFLRTPGGSTLWGGAPSLGQVNRISGASATEMTAFHDTSGGSHYTGLTASPLAGSNYISVFGSSSIPGETLAVGPLGVAISCNATRCIPSPTGDFNGLQDVFALDATHAFLIGELGTILY